MTTVPFHPALAAACVVTVIAAGCRSQARHASPSTAPTTMALTDDRPGATSRPTTRRQRPRMEHRLVMLAGRDDLSRGTFDHAAWPSDPSQVDPTPDGVVIDKPAVDFPLTGRWTSQTIASDFPFTELLPSWNARVPADTGVRFDVRVRDLAKQTWSPWLYIGYWGRVTAERRTIAFDGGEVDIDTLKLTRPADAFEVRATLMNYDSTNVARSPALRRVAAVYSRPKPHESVEPVAGGAIARRGDVVEPAPDAPPSTAPATRPVAVDLPVPFRPQGIEPESIRGSICSPTSVSMVLAWAGFDRPTLANAMAIWDDDYALFGNWNRAVQYAGANGFDAWLERFETMDAVRARLATGPPIVASINFRRGTFPSNVMQQTAGHLIVVRGFNEAGDLIVNDPASKDRGNGIVYKADELAGAWLTNSGGVGYVIRKK